MTSTKSELDLSKNQSRAHDVTFARPDSVLSAEKDVEFTELFLFGGIDIDIDLSGSNGDFEGRAGPLGGDSIGNRSRLSGACVGFWTYIGYGETGGADGQ